MKGIKQPVGFVKLTNVAVVRLKRHGIRFELACYKNKVQDWKSGVETDISEVLQIDNIFTNVSKGLVANKQELENAFEGLSRDQIIKTILSTGEVQTAELERGTVTESLVKDIANIVAEKTLNYKNFTRFPAMEAIHYAAKPGESAKKQALVVIKLLEKVLPIRRIRMRLGLYFPKEYKEKVHGLLNSKKEHVELVGETETEEGKDKISVLIEPNLYRDLVAFMKDHKGSVDVEDQYGELAKGKTQEEEGSQQEFMQLLENYEKMYLKEDKKEDVKKAKPAKKEQKEKVITCTSCKDAVFDNPKDYRAHVKSGWHVDNLKRKMEGLSILSKSEYEEKLLEGILHEGKK